MPGSISIEEFFTACKVQLERAEGVIQQPSQFNAELDELELILRNHWPDIISKLNDEGISQEHKDDASMIFQKIKKLETISNSRTTLFDGMEDFMQRSKHR